MLAYTTKKSLFPSAGCSSELIENPWTMEKQVLTDLSEQLQTA